jgi:hypothetical protein
VQVQVNDKVVKYVDEFIFVGSKVSSEGKIGEHKMLK